MKKQIFILLLFSLILTFSNNVFATTIYVCPSCGKESKTKSTIYKSINEDGDRYYECKKCGYIANDEDEFVETDEVDEDDTDTETTKDNRGVFQKIADFVTDFFANLTKYIINSILSLIAMILYAINYILYDTIGSTFIDNFINYSLNFESIGSTVTNVAATIKTLLASFSISLIVLFVLRNILLNYILWRGNPNENPLEVIIGIAMTTAMIAGFDDIYALIESTLSPIIKSVTGDTISFSEIPTRIVKGLLSNRFELDLNNNFSECMNIIDSGLLKNGIDKYFQLVIALLLSIYLFIKFCQALISAMKSGFELLALRLSAPMACLSLLNNNISAFSSYIKELIKRFFGILIKVTAINISIGLLSSFNSLSELLIKAFGILACIGIIENPGQILSAFTAGGMGGNELYSATSPLITASGKGAGFIKNRVSDLFKGKGEG